MVHSKQMVGGPFKGMNSSRDNSAKELLPARQEEALDQAAQQVAIQKKVAELRNKKAVMLLKNHKAAVALIDFVGIFLNMAFLPIAIYAFLSFAAQRLDGNNEASYFLLMLPAWVASLPLFGYVILNGLAARNTRINKCEKLALSILVPFGSLITLILLICYIEGLLSSTTAEGKPAKWLLVLFIPHLLSLLCLYLYLRCLVRPVKVHALPAKSAAMQQKK